MVLNIKVINSLIKRREGSKEGSGRQERDDKMMKAVVVLAVIMTMTCSDSHKQKWQIQKDNDMVTLEG
jgi:hypothetical protein